MKRIAWLLPLLSLLVSMSLSPRAFAQTELVTNGGFEFGNDGWFLIGAGVGARSNPIIPHSGSVNMVLGNVSGTTGHPTVQTVYQNVSIPSNAVNAHLSYWYNIYSTGAGASQQFYVYVATNFNLA